jgi:hypothetical protein
MASTLLDSYFPQGSQLPLTPIMLSHSRQRGINEYAYATVHVLQYNNNSVITGVSVPFNQHPSNQALNRQGTKKSYWYHLGETYEKWKMKKGENVKYIKVKKKES